MLDKSNKGCSIDGPKESARLGLKGSDPGAQLTEKETKTGSFGQVISAGLVGELAQGRKSQIGQLGSGDLVS